MGQYSVDPIRENVVDCPLRISKLEVRVQQAGKLCCFIVAVPVRSQSAAETPAWRLGSQVLLDASLQKSPNDMNRCSPHERTTLLVVAEILCLHPRGLMPSWTGGSSTFMPCKSNCDVGGGGGGFQLPRGKY